MNECRCGKPTRDAAYVCDPCADSLARALGDIPWLAEELEVTISRQKGVDYRGVGSGKGAKKASERPSPVVWGASEARAHLKAVMVSWALYAHQEGVRNSNPSDGLPADTLEALSGWLLWMVDGLTFDEIGSDAVDEITSAVAHCHRLIDRPADRQYLGTCPTCKAGRLYRRAGSQSAQCDVCQDSHNADEIKTRLLGELDDRLCTAAEIAHLSTYLGLKADREQVRKHVEYLARNDRITAHPSFSNATTYRFGEVYALLMQRDYGSKKAS